MIIKSCQRHAPLLIPTWWSRNPIATIFQSIPEWYCMQLCCSYVSVFIWLSSFKNHVDYFSFYDVHYYGTYFYLWQRLLYSSLSKVYSLLVNWQRIGCCHRLQLWFNFGLWAPFIIKASNLQIHAFFRTLEGLFLDCQTQLGVSTSMRNTRCHTPQSARSVLLSGCGSMKWSSSFDFSLVY